MTGMMENEADVLKEKPVLTMLISTGEDIVRFTRRGGILRNAARLHSD